MLDHIGIRVADFERSKKFYAAALAPLGYALFMEGASGAGFRKGQTTTAPLFSIRIATTSRRSVTNRPDPTNSLQSYGLVRADTRHTAKTYRSSGMILITPGEG